MNQNTSQSNGNDVFETFPAPRGWQFSGDIWAGNAHQKDTSDFLPGQETVPAIKPIEITIIRNASVR